MSVNTWGAVNVWEAGGITIEGSLVNVNYTSLNPLITLTSEQIKITESNVGTQYEALPPSIVLTPEPIAIVSTVCFDGHLVNLEYNGSITSLEFNGTIQTNC